MENEKRLIDANALLQSEVKRCRCIPTIGSGYSNETSFKLILDEAPTVDAVEVVRCKDCKHYKPRKQSVYWNETTPCCHRSAALKFPADGFCSYGEMKDNEKETT